MKKWNKSTDGASLPTYSLSKEYDSIWFATVFPRDGKYIFTIGQRIIKDEPTPRCTWQNVEWNPSSAKENDIFTIGQRITDPSRYTWQNVGWKNPSSAKAKAIEWINLIKWDYMKTIKYSVAYYLGIGETPMVILLDKKIGEFKRQYNTIEELKNDIGETPTIYYVADNADNRIDDLHSWNGKVFDFDELLKY